MKNVCLSPGSRNTPLTIAFAQNPKFKKYIHADERSSGFFALGLSKYYNESVAVVTTSGTAVAELYPSIIEAYYQRISLIICTADRPAFLRETGANQTINQSNIFGNHIRHFKDFGLPSLNEKKLKIFASQVSRGISIGETLDKGPIHFNFPFKKPLEPNTYSDEIPFNIKEYLVKESIKYPKRGKDGLKRLILGLKKADRPLIHIGWGTFNPKIYVKLLNFSKKYKVPILADGTTDIRFMKNNDALIISNHSSFLNFLPNDSDLIIQFGNAPTSASMLKYMEKTRAKRFLINEFGDRKDPSKKKGYLLKSDPSEVIDLLLQSKIDRNWKWWSEEVIQKERESEAIKSIIKKAKFGNESRIIMELLNRIPENSNIFLSNSLPIRDFDYFASVTERNLKVFVNRGASGIDGIISTASGIAANSKMQTYLVIGDLAFYHNVSALSTLNEYNIPLKIILINNSGGNIFRMLPVSNEKKYFKEYFIT
ncbi:MAG: 2-succinyl-5-enolpyruvyl-6-hydroxy-3-cyclohexene-1-carboxylic-acid synthase, partial [Melioribacteraceae bacterium]|nr:2-succinyl-5-enolpyruvyl-6-hydroxy-3-cyclohexene-1-carboxylic-acid synthase [Melioribacteraceae bacterium]